MTDVKFLEVENGRWDREKEMTDGSREMESGFPSYKAYQKYETQL